MSEPADTLTVKFPVPTRLHKDREEYTLWALAMAEAETRRLVDWVFGQSSQVDAEVFIPPPLQPPPEPALGSSAAPTPEYEECLSCQ